MRYALLLEYNGTHYAGFQIQSNARTIQGEVECALAILLGRPVRISFAGRTDAGVHATGQIISFTQEKLPADALGRALNGLLPRDIAVRGASRVPEDFHPRYSCVAREYEYLIWNHPLRSALWYQKALWLKQSLCITKLNQEVQCILGLHDFSAFTPQARSYKNPKRYLYSAEFVRDGISYPQGGLLRFRICANAFLHNMIRVILGTLIDISLGRITQSLQDILASRMRQNAGQTIGAGGLYLRHAYYLADSQGKASLGKDTCLTFWQRELQAVEGC